jgi:mutator protein MutT
MQGQTPESAPRLRIAIAVVRWRQEVLVGFRASDVPLPGMAEFPGGKCLPQETPEEAAARECLEETGIAVRVRRRLCEVEHTYPHGHLHLTFVECEPIGTREPRPPFRWVPIRQLPELSFPEANAAVLRIVLHEAASEEPGPASAG